MKRKLPRGIRLLENGVYRLYTTRNGRPFQPQVTWELLKDLGVPVPAKCRLQHPGLELAKIALVKQQSKIVDEVRTGVVEATAKTKIGDLLELIEQDYLKAGKKTWTTCMSRWNLHLKGHFAERLRERTQQRPYQLLHPSPPAGGARRAHRSIARWRSSRRMMHLGERTTPPLVRGVPHFPKVKESDPRTGFFEQARVRQAAAACPRVVAARVAGHVLHVRISPGRTPEAARPAGEPDRQHHQPALWRNQERETANDRDDGGGRGLVTASIHGQDGQRLRLHPR